MQGSTAGREQDANALVLRLTGSPEQPLGDVLPTLRMLGNETIESPHVDKRCRTTLGRMQCSTWAQLAEKSTTQLFAVPNSGQLTVSRLLTAAARRHLDEVARPAATSHERSSVGGQPDSANYSELQRLRQVLIAVSAWAVRERSATTLSDVIQLSDDLGRIPPELVDGFRDLAASPISDYVGAITPELPADLLRNLFDSWTTRTDVLAKRKIARGVRLTLEELGSEIGVSRERVRQLEAEAAKDLDARLRSREFAPLRWRASDLADVLGPAVPCDSEFLRDAVDWASRDLDDLPGVTAGDFMLWAAGPYEADGSWLVAKPHSIAGVMSELDARLCASLLANEAEVRIALDDLGLAQPVLAPLMAGLKGWRALDESSWVRWSGTVGDKAAVVLELTGTPCNAQEVNEFIGEGHAESSVRNAMAADDRFVRIDKAGTFALASWGVEEYSGVANEIIERIERANGPVRVDDLVREFVSEFGVSENSVRMYSSAPAFVTQNGLVRLRGDDEPFVVDRRVDQVRGLYLLPDGKIVVHDVVDRDVLRGSGRGFPDAAAVRLGVEPGDRATFESERLGTVVISWPRTATTGPSIGSTRQIAQGLDLKVGDAFRLILDGDRREFDAERVGGASVRELTGVNVSPGEELDALAAAVETEPRAVRAVLHARGELELLGLLPEFDAADELGDAISDFGALLEP